MNRGEIILPIVSSPRLSKPAERFYLFIHYNSGKRITEENIINYYKEKVADPRMQLCKWGSEYENGVWQSVLIELSDEETRSRALNWFDKWLGRFIRLNLIIKLKILTP